MESPASDHAVMSPAGAQKAGAGVNAPARGEGGRRWSGWAGLVLLLAPLVIYGRAFPFGLLGLDDGLLYGDPHLHGGAAAGLAGVWTGTVIDDYIPLTMVTMWVDRALGDGAAWHIARLQQPLWLGFGAWAVFAAMRRMCAARAGEFPWLAWTVALLYDLHPLCANATLWLAERKNLVAFAVAWWCLERYVAWRQGGRPGLRYVVWILAVAALLAKPHAVAIPVMMAAWEMCLGPDGRGWAGLWADAGRRVGAFMRMAIPRMLPIAPVAVVVAAFVAAQMHFRQDLGAIPLGGNRLAALWCDGWILASYLGETVWPRNLTIYYDVVEEPGAIGVLAASWAVVIAACAATLALARRRHLVLCGWLLALAGLLPALNLVVQAVPKTDHYVQWALPGLVLVVVVTVADVFAGLQFARARVLLGASTALVLALLSFLRVPEFASRDTFFATAFTKRPDTMNLCEYTCGLITRDGPYAEPAGALALRAIRNQRGGILFDDYLMLSVAGGVEAWRQEGRAAAEKIVGGIPDGHSDARLLVHVKVLIGASRITAPGAGPGCLDEAARLLAARLGPAAMARAEDLAARCRSGETLPCDLPPGPDLPLAADATDPGQARADVYILALTLIEVRMRAGDAAGAFAEAALCLNLYPQDAQARRAMAMLYTDWLRLPEAAARVLPADPSSPHSALGNPSPQ